MDPDTKTAVRIAFATAQKDAHHAIEAITSAGLHANAGLADTASSNQQAIAHLDHAERLLKDALAAARAARRLL